MFGRGAIVSLVGMALIAGAPPPVLGDPSTVNAPALHAPSSRPFGTLPDGRTATLYLLEVPGGWKTTITDYGAIVTSFHVPPRPGAEGDAVDVALGFDSLDGYLKGHPYFGAICGRVGNRIAGATFDLDGKTYRLAANNGAHHLHGGVTGFDKKLWKGTPRLSSLGPAVEFVMVSPDGDEGYPGGLTATVTYTLTRDGELWVEMTATTDAPTLVNLVQHSYWNLAGQHARTIRDHELTMMADRYVPTDDAGIPTGQLADVAQTSFDLRPERPAARIGAALERLPPRPAGGNPGGIDHTFVIRGWKPDGALRPAALLRDPASGRTLTVLTDQPGIQVYTGNFLDGTLTGKGGATYAKQAAICLETQTYPDTAHHPEWPPQRLDPGQTYRHTMVHRFAP
jgi:aldose 1-epimerase